MKTTDKLFVNYSEEDSDEAIASEFTATEHFLRDNPLFIKKQKNSRVWICSVNVAIHIDQGTKPLDFAHEHADFELVAKMVEELKREREESEKAFRQSYKHMITI